MIHVAITNESSAMTDAQVAPIVAALQKQASGDFAPFWGIDAQVAFYPKGKQPHDAWWLVCLDTSDQAGALGYHDVTPAELPIGKAFVGSDIKAGYSPSVTLSHELLEMLADPDIIRTVQVGQAEFWAYESADPVEADQLGYTIDGVQVSDFVTPAWFEAARPKGAVYDFMRHCSRPRQLLAGGYQSIWTPHGGWTQKTAQGHAHSYADRPRVGSRRERRRTPRELWLPSTVQAA